MRKIVLLAAIFSIFAATAFSAPFAPTVLKLTAAPTIAYKFDGSSLSIPVTVAGVPADVSFMVFTKGKAASISKITNGYLGWHYVNNIDTCLYLSATNALVVGSNTISWNGKNKAGTAVAKTDLTYYLFGYDNKSPKVKMTAQLGPNPWGYRTILEKDSKGVALAKPIMYMSDAARGIAATAFKHTLKKWIVGNDPEDATLVETTTNMGWTDVGGIAFLPTDQTKYFHDTLQGPNTKKVTRAWSWVPNGDSVLRTDWGTNGEYIYSVASPAGWNFGPGVVSDGGSNLLLSNADISNNGKESKLIIIDASDGSDIKKLDLAKWWVNLLEGGETVGGQYTGGPTELSVRNGLVALGSHSTCVNSLVDPSKDTVDTAVLWVNRNGDIIGDHNWETTTKKPWVCNDYNVGPYKYTTSMDNQGFVVFPAFDMGAVSFGLYAPDGTGIAYKAYAGETAAQKYGLDFIDYASPYDGIYAGAVGVLNPDGKTFAIAGGFYFTGHDSVKGVIQSGVGVDEAAPASFAVSQNTPNPFNPTTSISFTLAKAGKVTVDIYNAAGQKVDTVVNTTISAGNHSITWNASRFSAGVYFYTVKSGDFSKTMKMTLLK
ncbi:MAG: FlgD immunoglobulin-like domain containing protein [Candidatus Latescibacter sp.]|nr:FlgD immunoglobulin-like domain containing protein [Candidatus Latescibacter sp.]